MSKKCLIIIIYFKQMENTHTACLVNAPILQHIKINVNQLEPQSPSQNEVFSFQDSQQQKYGLLITFPIATSEFNSFYYQIKEDILMGTPIKPLMRTKIRVWLYQETAKLKLSRRVCCLTVTLIDLFFSKGGTVEVEQFHSMSLACLLLANKLTDNRTIPIDLNVFPLSQLISWETTICLRLQFKLNPAIYVETMERLLQGWNLFAKLHSLWQYKGFKIDECSNDVKDCNKFFEGLDVIYLALKSYQFPKGLLQFCLFKILIQRDSNKIMLEQVSIEDEVLIKFWENPQECSFANKSFQFIFQQFTLFIEKVNPWLGQISSGKRQEAEQWIRNLLAHNPSFDSRSRKYCSPSDPSVQTFCEKWFPEMRQYLRPKRAINLRKGSSDTTA